jgi:phosphate transport system substrate-binding protein
MNTRGGGMNRHRIAAGLVLVLGAGGLAAQPAAAQGLRIEAEAGAAGFIQLAQQEYAKANPAFAAALGVNSSAAALAGLCRGAIAAAGTARPIAPAEREACAKASVEPVELPLGTDAIALVVNPRNTWAKQLSVADLRHASLEATGKARSWKQLNAAWPDRPLKLYGPAPKLGLAQAYGKALKAGVQEPLRGDMTSTEVLSSVLAAVARDPMGLGVVDWASYYGSAARVRVLGVEFDGKAVQPSEQALRDGSYRAFSYPVTLYVSSKALQAPAMRGFVEHALANAERLAAQAGLAPLAAADYRQASRRLGNPNP